MNIDEIIRKCVEVPGISIERGEYSAGLFLNEKDGKGFVTFFPLFPGLTLAYISVNAPLWTAPDLRGEGSDEKGPLLLNYCVTGRCEIILNNGNFVYVTDGDLSLTEHFAQRQYVYPRRIYEGLEFFAELDTLAAQSVWLLEEFGLDFHCVVERYCRNGSTYISNAVFSADGADGNPSVPGLRLFYGNAGEYCKAGRTDYHSRPAAASSGLGTGREVFYQ